MKEEGCSSRESRKAETGGKQLTLPNQNQIYYILKVNLFHFDFRLTKGHQDNFFFVLERENRITFQVFRPIFQGSTLDIIYRLLFMSLCSHIYAVSISLPLAYSSCHYLGFTQFLNSHVFPRVL